jgi:hypothetical protein
MTTSVVSICNTALDLLGSDSIASLADDSKAARFCARNYERVRDAVLRAYPWNCAVARASLAALAQAPAWGYGRQYPLPDGPDPAYCLRALAINGEVDFALTYKIEGRRILTDEDAPLKILYIARVEDPSLYDALLTDAISARLALDAAYPLAGSVSLAQAMSQAYAEKLAEARQVDSQEGTPDALIAGDWLESRF